MRTRSKLFALGIATALVACSVNAVTFRLPPVTIGVTITGFDGAGLVLTNNGRDDLAISGNGVFAFTTPLERGTSYAVEVKSQPSNPVQMCSVTNGNGTAGEEAVIDVQVSCRTTTFSLGGTVTGLAGAGLVLQNNAGDNLAVNADGTFAFATPVASGARYDVTVAMQPSLPTQSCTVANGTGTLGGSNVMNVDVTCVTRTFTIGGTVTGLRGGGLRLQDNVGDDLAIGADGGFTFATPIASGATFVVRVLTQPAGPSQTCTVSGGTGTVGGGSVTSVAINCTTNAFTIGGTVSGLTGTGLVLQDNGGDNLPIPGNGPFTFLIPIASGATYTVTVKAQPSGQTCTVTRGTGTVGASNVTDIQVTCGDPAWSLSLFPIAVPGSDYGVGDLDLDNNGDLLVVVSNPARAIVRVNHVTGAQTTVATGIGTGFLLGVAYRAANDMIYTNTDNGQIFAVTPTGTVTLLAAIGGGLNAIAIAPPSFGSFGGFLIGATQSGLVAAVNPVTGAVTTITAAAGAASDLAFAPDGTLYTSGGPTVRTVTAAGVVTPFITSLSSADGITIAPDGARMFIADSGTRTARQVTIPGAVVTTIGSASINGGTFVGGIVAAPGNTLIVLTDTNRLSLVAFPY